VDNHYARRVPAAARRAKEVHAMFKELADELLDLTATAQPYRKPYLAQMRPGMLCCCCSCCCCDVFE
jgi:hypothetical protein